MAHSKYIDSHGPTSSDSVGATFIVPPENVQDKVAFIFNNLSQVNLQYNCVEIKKIVPKKYLPWLSQYWVTKRVINELYCHSLYSKFLDCLNSEIFNSFIISETFRNIKIVLKKRTTNISDRTSLKNLGQWLGMITLAKNKPISLDDIDLEMILTEAYGKGHQELLLVVPFIANVLMSCAKSEMFGPRNPWTMSLMNCLAALHQKPDLKRNLKYEVEILYKALNIKLKPVCTVTKTTYTGTSSLATDEDTHIVPPKYVQDKVSFIFNNLSRVNLQSKCVEIKKIVPKNCLPWLSKYWVTKRVVNELNHHSLYSKFLDCLNSEIFNSFIISETFRNIKIVLKKRTTNISDRTSLKNLGQWLGMITLAKNKPISLDDIDLEMILTEAYGKGHQELLLVVPFIANVLMSCAKSEIFGPRNPWTMSLMNCLAALHQKPDLKRNLKYEVEILYKALNIKLKPVCTVTKTTYTGTSSLATDEDTHIVPPKYVQDKVSFIFNNLSRVNLQSKCVEIKKIVPKNCLPWLSKYWVTKRVVNELNHHSLYSKFLDCLNSEIFNSFIISETFRNIKIVLKKRTTNISDRTSLKNLGQWLGMITLAKNKPISLDDIDLEMILTEAYGKGHQELLLVVPFIANVLMSCAKSEMFGPRNPWTMSLMNCLAALHQKPDLKRNLKYEVEILYKALNIKLKPVCTVTKTTYTGTSSLATDEDTHIVPPKYVQDKVSFIFNNLSRVNLQSKCVEIKKIVPKNCLPWLSKYWVTKRVVNELNHHSLYSKFLDCLNSEIFNSFIISETFRNIKIVLKKRTTNISDRTSLKNLGQWLGMITLAKNKPISLDDIDLEMILTEAYGKGHQELLLVVPFIANVLMSCAKSEIFGPRNPWTMSLMNCLAALHQKPDLKRNLKYEVEILYKALNIKLKPVCTVTKTTYTGTSSLATDEDTHIVPPKYVQDKVSFIFNNLSRVNLQSKCVEIKKIVPKNCLPWLSKYWVTKRVVNELNHHSLYSKFLDCLNSEIFNSFIISETFRNIKIVLKKRTTNISDRTSLKNLGQWLGMITLAKNKPISLDDIDLEMILTEAYGKGHQELLLVVPFIANVLMSCAKSEMFGPRNPWTMSLMNCLAALHQKPDLKRNLKYEVEILYKALNIKLKPVCTVTKTTYTGTSSLATDEDTHIVPPKYVQDKVSFIFNNLSRVNLQSKCVEIKKIVPKNCLPWLSKYWVTKRVVNELNLHSLYSKFLDCLNSEIFNSFIISETFRNIKVVLKKRTTNISDRTSLKNLGQWLGMITLAKNKPISLDDIDLEMILTEAYGKGHQELLLVVPFIANVLMSCAKSEMFGPRNPWTMSLMNCLAALHQKPELKINLKFEVEILCNALDIKLKDLKPEYVLKNPEITKNLQLHLSDGENSKSQNDLGPQNISVSTPRRQNVLFKALNFVVMYVFSFFATICEIFQLNNFLNH